MDIFIRDFPIDLHRNLKIMAAQKRITLKALIIKILDLYKDEEEEKD